MAYYKGNGGNDRTKNAKLQRFIFKFSAFSSLVCFLTLFVGWVGNNTLTEVVDSKSEAGSSSSFLVLSNDDQQNIETIRKNKDLDVKSNDVINCSEVGGKKIYVIDRAVKLNVSVHGGAPQSIEVPSKSTVEVALQRANADVGEHDELFVEEKNMQDANKMERKAIDRNTKVCEGMNIVVDKVEFKEVVEEASVAFKTVEVEKGTSCEGKNGRLRRTFKVKLVNGVEDAKSKQLIKEEEIAKPVNKIVVKQSAVEKTSKTGRSKSSGRVQKTAFGACSAQALGQLLGNNVKHLTEIKGIATAYAPTGRKTSSGTCPQVGRTVAVPRGLVKRGKTVDIFSARTGKPIVIGARVEDTMGNRSAVVDLFKESEQACNRFGKQQVVMKVRE